MEDEYLKELNNLLYLKSYKQSDDYDGRIIYLIGVLLLLIIQSNDYQKSLYIRNNMDVILERYGKLSLIQLVILIKNLENLSKIERHDINYDFNHYMENSQFYLDMYKKMIENLTQIPDVRLSQSNYNFDIQHSTEEKYQLLSFLVELFQFDLSKLTLKNDDWHSLYMILLAIRKLSLDLNILENFYFASYLYIDSENHNSEYQSSRDLSEELLIGSYSDSMPEYGYLTLFKTYSSQHSFNTAILIANIILQMLLLKKQCTTQFLKMYLITLQKLFRNIGFFEQEEKMFNYLNKNIPLVGHEYESIHFIHFQCKLLEKDFSIVSNILQFLNKERENILSSFAIGKSTRWLNMLYNVKHIFEDKDTSELDYFINIFESAALPEDVKLLKATIFLNDDFKEYFIRELLGVMKSRYKEDIVKEVVKLKVWSGKLVQKSYKEQLIEEFLLTMLIKSDISFHFEERERGEPQKTRKVNDEKEQEYITKYAEFFNNYLNHFIENVRLYNNNDTILWLAESEDRVYQLKFSENSFSAIEMLNIDMDKMKTFINTVTEFKPLDSDFIQDREFELHKMKNELKNFQLKIENSNILLVKDLSISGFPHNLFLNDKKDYISLSNPITNILSSEWFIKEAQKEIKLKDCSTSIWIPTEDNDFALLSLYSKLEDYFNRDDIKVFTNKMPEKPLDSEINIAVAHGAKDIASLNLIYSSKKQPTENFEDIISDGKIMILFVCHSGSMDKQFLGYKVNSFVRYFIDNGYSSVIAPFWGLHTNVIPIWLPKFIKEMKQGEIISKSFFNANKTVYEKFPDPGSWACLHLYGNPYLKLSTN